MQKPSGYGMPDLRLRIIHGTRFGGIKGYGIGWRAQKHSMIRHQKGLSEEQEVGNGRGRRGPLRAGDNIQKRTKASRGRRRRTMHQKKRHHSRHHFSGRRSHRFTHNSVVDVAPTETMHGLVGYRDRVDRNRRTQQPLTKIYGNLGRHRTSKQLAIGSGTPRTYVNSQEFESNYLGHINRGH